MTRPLTTDEMLSRLAREPRPPADRQCRGCGAELARKDGPGRPPVWCSAACRGRSRYRAEATYHAAYREAHREQRREQERERLADPAVRATKSALDRARRARMKEAPVTPFSPTAEENVAYERWARLQPFPVIAAIHHRLHAGVLMEARRTEEGVDYRLGDLEFHVPNRVLASRSN